MSNDHKVKEFTLSLVRAESEQEVDEVLSRYGFKDDESAWCTLGDKNTGEGGVVSNQQSDPERALIEKVINSVDAVLIKEATEKYGDPLHKDVPRSMKEAVSEFFNVGDINTLDTKKELREKMPGNIGVSVTGSKESPSITIADLGEGQGPEKFPDTFLRLTKSPKINIHFVQGKYGMGGTGVLRFCGKFHYNLIISKRNIKSEKDAAWGVTVLRRLVMGDDDRLAKFVYLKPKGKILSFNAKSLEIYPTKKGAHTGKMTGGTFIKLYEYRLSNTSQVSFDTYRTLSKLVPDIALPVNIFEHRSEFKKQTDIVLDGLRARFMTSDGKSEPEQGFPSRGNLIVDRSELPFEIFAFRKNSKIKDQYAKADTVIFMNNGQNQGSISKNDFFGNSVLEKAGFNYIKDDILILLYCNSLKSEQNYGLFLGDRERLTKSTLLQRIKQNLIQELVEHEGLRELAQKRRQELLSESSGEIADVVNRLIPKILDKSTMDEILNIGIDIPTGNEGISDGTGRKEKFFGKKYPTFFEIEGEKVKDLPVNGKYAVITFNTDVENNYFDRRKSPGELKWANKESEHFDLGWLLWEGKLKIRVTPLKGTFFVGQQFHFSFNINDEAQKIPFSLEFSLQITEKKIKPVDPKKPGKTRERKPKNKGGKSLPKFNEVRREDWDSHNFTDESAVSLQSLGENNYDYYINMDNRYLLRENQKEPTDKIFHEKQYVLSMTLITLAIIGRKNKILGKRGEGEESGEEYIKMFVESATSTISSLIFPIINELSKKAALNKV